MGWWTRLSMNSTYFRNNDWKWMNSCQSFINTDKDYGVNCWPLINWLKDNFSRPSWRMLVQVETSRYYSLFWKKDMGLVVCKKAFHAEKTVVGKRYKFGSTKSLSHIYIFLSSIISEVTEQDRKFEHTLKWWWPRRSNDNNSGKLWVAQRRANYLSHCMIIF